MTVIQETIIEQIKSNGVIYALLLGALIWMEHRSSEIESKMYDCQNSVNEIYKEYQVQLIRVIESNTTAITNLQMNQYEIKVLVEKMEKENEK